MRAFSAILSHLSFSRLNETFSFTLETLLLLPKKLPFLPSPPSSRFCSSLPPEIEAERSRPRVSSASASSTWLVASASTSWPSPPLRHRGLRLAAVGSARCCRLRFANVDGHSGVLLNHFWFDESKDNQLAGVIGGSGGMNIIPAVTQVFLDRLVLGMEPSDAFEYPRFSHS